MFDINNFSYEILKKNFVCEKLLIVSAVDMFLCITGKKGFGNGFLRFCSKGVKTGFCGLHIYSLFGDTLFLRSNSHY